LGENTEDAVNQPAGIINKRNCERLNGFRYLALKEGQRKGTYKE
jgi:hypothetical protein